jgi:5-methyltetrahydropteroyltriglutamate--homocysteine methyltransferase
MKRSTDTILTTHTGSLPRRDELLPLLIARDQGKLADEADFQAKVGQAVRDIVRRQRETGIDIVNDGEQGKYNYSTYIKDRLSGFDGEPVPVDPRRDQAEFPDYANASLKGAARPSGPTCSGPVAWKDFSPVQQDIDNLKAATAAQGVEEAFMSAVSPGQAARFMPNRYYQSDEAYLQALAEAMRDEYNAIVQAGFILQIDCPDLASGWNNQFRDLSVPQFQKVVAMHIEMLNHATRDIAPDRMRMHLCWGNYEGPHNHDIPIRDIIGEVFKARPAGISFEGANPRHAHEWKVFRDVKLPEGKLLIPGVLDSTSNFVEHPELVAERICNYARLVGRENVMAGTDCGFATSAGESGVFPTVAWAKMRAMVEGARLASKELWQ